MARRFGRDARGRLRDHEQDAAGARQGFGDRDHRRREGQGRDHRRRHDHDRRHAVAGAEALQGGGRDRVFAFATHGLSPDGALERFADSDLDEVVVTDTVPIDPLTRPEKMTVLPVSRLLAETIMNVFADDSVSAIFGGENQLFLRTDALPERVCAHFVPGSCTGADLRGQIDRSGYSGSSRSATARSTVSGSS